jgi:L,D-peptidoglycan transpeptidase YkuD (ErfK/YbiS/YcfS/YnhG family)
VTAIRLRRRVAALAAPCLAALLAAGCAAGAGTVPVAGTGPSPAAQAGGTGAAGAGAATTGAPSPGGGAAGTGGGHRAGPGTHGGQAAGSHPATHRGPGQLITVTAARYGATYARLTAYRRSGHGWRRVFGPWTARIGRGGFAPPGRKREGDGRTPSGTFSIPFFFGALPDPGVRFAYRRAGPADFWDDDPASPHYNEWVDQRRASPGANPEPMDVSGYDYGAVIGYNAARVAGLGSAIFLHVNIGIATAGCVTLPMSRLLAVLRWLDPAASPRIRMGVR